MTFDLHVPQQNENILFEIQYEMGDLFIYSFIVSHFYLFYFFIHGIS